MATWIDYEAKFTEDYLSCAYYDRIEGTAHYFEIKTCLYAAYPNEIKTERDFQNAVALYASRPEFEIGTGTVSEGYCVGAMGCVLLDRLGVPDWQDTLMSDEVLSPLDILAQQYTDLPAAKEVPQESIDEVTENIAKFNNGDERWSNLFTMLYQLLF